MKDYEWKKVDYDTSNPRVSDEQDMDYHLKALFGVWFMGNRFEVGDEWDLMNKEDTMDAFISEVTLRLNDLLKEKKLR